MDHPSGLPPIEMTAAATRALAGARPTCSEHPRRRRALLLRPQGFVQQPHRWLRPRRPDDCAARHHRPAVRGRASPARGCRGGSQRPRISISSQILRAVLAAAGLHGSMGRVASGGDNAAMKSRHALLQKNVLVRRRWRTRDELHEAVVFWIEHTYNRRRRQRGLGKLTPVEFEVTYANQDAAVAALISPTAVNRSCGSPTCCRRPWRTPAAGSPPAPRTRYQMEMRESADAVAPCLP